MGNWIKQNLVLTSGILLPVLLVGGFFILNRLPRLMVDPPVYDFLLVAFHNDYQNAEHYYLDFDVQEGKLIGHASPSDLDHQHYNRQGARIFRYRVSSNSYEEIVFDLPDGLDQIETVVPIDLAVTDHLPLDKRVQSPDGYQFEYLGYQGNGGLLGDIFGMGNRYQSSHVLKKGDYLFSLPELTVDLNYYSNDLQFMGWISPGQPTP